MVLANIVGPDGLILVVVALVVLFGGSQLPKLARGLGSASHEFRKGMEEGAADSKSTETDKTDKTDKTDSAS